MSIMEWDTYHSVPYHGVGWVPKLGGMRIGPVPGVESYQFDFESRRKWMRNAPCYDFERAWDIVVGISANLIPSDRNRVKLSLVPTIKFGTSIWKAVIGFAKQRRARTERLPVSADEHWVRGDCRCPTAFIPRLEKIEACQARRLLRATALSSNVWIFIQKQILTTNML